MSEQQSSFENGSPLCEARGVSHDFTLPNGKPFRVIEDINLTIMPEEVVALLGPSGCGKSTILRILAGLITPTHGEVLYHGNPLQGLNPGVATVFQSFALYPWMTVEQNVHCALKAAGLPPSILHERAQQTIGLVGLSGFDEAYPRELSGGMKQRVGIARALSVDPELLFMDEPFSQVDALTAESLRAEVIDIWIMKNRNPSSILMVSHDIREVVYMADRIIVLSANPGRVRRCVENRLPRPRDYRSAEFLQLVDQIHEIITGSELPDIPSPELPREPFIIEPLPEASTSEIIGLLEYLDARGGKADLFRITSDTDREFGHVITVVKAAEMLNFVDTPKRLVVLDPEGQRFVRATAQERKVLWREQLLKLHLFQEIQELMARTPQQEIDRSLVLEAIVFSMPYENYERVFETFVRWARFGELFAYDETAEQLFPQ